MRRFHKAALATLVGSMILVSGVCEARIKRSSAAISAFKHSHPCPSTGAARGRCPGWIIDHVAPLACGGDDTPSNMQWQTIDDAKAKDKWERRGCSPRH